MTSSGIGELLRSATNLLNEAGVPDSRWDSELLMTHVLDCNRADLYTADLPPLDPSQQRAFTDLIRRRCRREPLQYLIGKQEFWGLEFHVSPEVLIPRPETESLIEAVGEQFPDRSVSITLADIGTGSGCLAITLAGLYSNARILAVDFSGAALEVARLNAARYAPAQRIEFLEGDLCGPLISMELKEKMDLLISNPPYIPSPEIGLLQAEVQSYEPRIALDGGRDGLDYFRRILIEGFDCLRPGGHFVLEMGNHQANPISDMALHGGWQVVRIKPDQQSIPRVILLRKPEDSAGASARGVEALGVKRAGPHTESTRGICEDPAPFQPQRPPDFKRVYGSAGASAGARGACEDPAPFQPQRPPDFNG